MHNETLNSNIIMVTPKAKILYLITKSNWGGAQRYVYDLAAGLPQNEFEAVVALGGDGPLAERLRESGIRVISIPSLQRDISLIKECVAFVEIANIIRTEEPDILHINSSKAGILGALLGRLLLVPKIIFTSHGWAFNEERPGWQKVILKTIHWLTVLLAHQTIAVSEELKRQMDWPGTQNKMSVIHNGRSVTGLLSKDEARTYLCERFPQLLPYQNDFWSITIGELHPVKRHEAVIDAIKELIETEPNTRHLIIGEGGERKALEEQIEKLNLVDHVFLLGAIDEAAKYLKAADMFILASRSEGMPYVLIESLFAGLPVVATRVGGIPEVIDHNVEGLLTPPLDNKALFEAILSLRQGPELRSRLGEKALEKSQEFSLEKTLEKTLSLYRTN